MAEINNEEANTTKAPVNDKKENIENVKVVAAVAYILFFVPLITNPDSQFAKYHANQGLVLLITAIVLNMISGVLMAVLIGFLLLPLVSLFVIVLAIMGIVNALNGEMKPLPLIGGIQLIK